MFRKPKNAKKAAFRKRQGSRKGDGDDNDDGGGGSSSSGPSRPRAFRKRDDSSSDEDNGVAAGGGGESTSDLLEQIRRDKEGKKSKKRRVGGDDDDDGDGAPSNGGGGVMHEFGTQEDRLTASDLATRTAEHHPTAITRGADGSGMDGKDGGDGKVGGDGVYRGQSQTRNKFLAGPIKAPSFVRTTCRFDYQPDICKDYKDTGFCGFGDTCIYLHDRGDTMSGWQLEQQWEERKKKEREDKEREMEKFLASAAGGGDADGDNDDEAGAMTEDGLPFACHICRNAFEEPVVTTCGHYFCQKCILGTVRGGDASCPICKKDTHGVFNHPSKLVSKKRRLVGSKGTWLEFAEAAKRKGPSEDA